MNEWCVICFFLYDIIFWLLLKIILQRSLSERLIHFKRAINKNETFYFFIRFWYQILIRLHYYTFAKILKIKWFFIFSLEKLICMFFTSSLLSSPKSGPNLMQNLNSSILSLHLGEKSLSIVGGMCNLALFAATILDFALTNWNPKSKILAAMNMFPNQKEFFLKRRF